MTAVTPDYEELAGCAWPEAAVASEPDPVLDELTFLHGCWSYWSVDWGFAMCWRRERDAWVGEAFSTGVMGPVGRNEIRIGRSGGEVRIEWRMVEPLWPWMLPQSLPLASHAGPDRVSFSDGEHSVSFSLDRAACVLHWTRDQAYESELRRPLRRSDGSIFLR